MAAAGFRYAFIALLCVACTSIAPNQRTFDGTHWHVAAINGRPTPPSNEYRLEFTRDILSGKFGCNAFGGPYAVKGDIMTAGQIESTLIGCFDPAGSFEHDGFAVLRQPMRLIWSGERRLTLSNSNGAVVLERTP